MSGGKGPSQSGNITQSTSNKLADTLLPYQQAGWDAARYTFDNNPTPPSIAEGYDKQYDIAKNYSADLTGAATGSLKDTLYGGMSANNSPSSGSLFDLSYGNTPAQGTLRDLSWGGTPQQLALNTTGNELASLGKTADSNYTAGTASLAKTAAGDYLNANPYLDKMYDSASRGVTRAYQTATAPNTDSTYETAGRYGSGAMASARSQNQQDLGVTLDDLASSIYGKNYATERGYQNTAANNLGTLGQGQQKLQGSLLDAAGGLYDKSASGMERAANNLISGMGTSASSLMTGYNNANSNTNTALGLYPGTQKETFYPATQMTAAGQGLQMEPYGNVAEYLKLLGNPATGSSSTTTPVLGPNGLTSALGTAGSALGLANSAGGLGLFDSLGGTGAASLGADFGGGGAAMGIADSIPLAFEAAPLAAATIICTELMRQGRMPVPWWVGSSRDWTPDIAYKGYLVWARPSVRHLRRRPYSLYSRLLCVGANWRGQDAAARHGIDPKARRLWRGRAITAVIALPCLALGLIAAIGERHARALRRT